MIKIPQNLKFTQLNNSDLTGNIWYTKNINFTEKGYAKLSSRVVSLINSEDDTDFNIPSGFGRYGSGGFYVATNENPYILSLSDGGASSLIKDTDNGNATPPTMDGTTYGAWWRNLWHITNNTKLYYKTVSTGDWTDTGISLTTGKAHSICAFEKTNTLLIGNSNSVKQVDSSYATGTLSQLTLSAEYEVLDIVYNNNLVGIGTRLASSSNGQDKEAGLFIWDGAGTSANAMYTIGADSVVSVVAYKSSFAILTSKGKLLYFNGGGFDELASLPVFYKDLWGDFANVLGRGTMMKVSGNNIYININNTITDDSLGTYLESMIAGVWVYDPEVGLSHRYSPSITKAQVLSVQQADVDTTNNKMTVYNTFSLPTSPTIPDTGNPVKILDTSIGGLTEGQIYFIIKVSTTEFRLATTREDALNLTPVDLTSTGGTFSFFMVLNVKDYGQNKSSNVGSVNIFGSKAYSYENILFGGRYNDTNSATVYDHLCISVAGFKNIGYIVTPKLMSQNIEDIIQNFIFKYRPLDTNDRIILKSKSKEILGIPEFADCTATSNTVFTTTSLIPKSYAYTDELECEIISGAGSGQMSKITSITYNAGTYTITLEDEMEGISASDLLSIKIDNWKECGIITSDDSENWKQIAIAQSSKSPKFKIVLEGNETTIEELQIINATQIPSA